MFDKILEAYQIGDQNMLNGRIRSWMDSLPENPFEMNTPEHDLFFKAQRAHKRWRSGSISGRLGRREMLEYVTEIAKIYVERRENNGEKHNAESDSTKSSTSIPEAANKKNLDVAQHVLGVVPDKKVK